MKNPNCALCELHKTCKNVCVWGEGPRPCRIMFIGEALGASEEMQGSPFVGEAGQVFNQMLEAVEINRKDIYLTNVCKCRPPDNRVPTNEEIEACSPYLEEEIKEVKPGIIVPMGNTATQYFLGLKGITKLAGREFVSKKFNCKVIPLLHPANILRVPEHFEVNVSYLRKIKNILEGNVVQPVKYVVADTWDRVLTLFKRLREVPEFSVDVETTGFDFLTKTILCVGFSWKETTAVILPILGYKCREIWTAEQKSQIMIWLKEVMEGPAQKIMQNGAFDYKFFKNIGITITNFDFDTMLMHHLLDENAKGFHGLDSLALLYTDMGNYDEELEKHKLELTQNERLERAQQLKAIKKDEDLDGDDKEEMIEELKEKPLNFSYADIPEQVLWKYLGGDADATFRVKNCLLELLKKETLEKLHIFPEHRDKNLLRVLTQIVMPLRTVLNEMEYKGALLDIEYLKKLDIEYTQKIKEINEEFAKTIEIQQAQTIIHQKLCEKMGIKYDNLKVKRGTRTQYIKKYAKKVKFNLNSAIQLRILLFDVLKLKVIEQTKTGAASTGKKTLEKYAKKSEFIKRLVDNRHFQKFHKTYVVGMPSLIDTNGRIHTDFNSHGTVTGRLCVAGDTILETTAGRFKIADLDLQKFPNVLLFTHKGRLRPIMSKFYKGQEKMYEITNAEGNSFKCTKGHRILTPTGWQHSQDLRVGDIICTADNYSPTLFSRPKRNTCGGKFCSNISSVKDDCKTGSRGIQFKPRNVNGVEGVLQTKVFHGIKVTRKISQILDDERKHTGAKGMSIDNHSSRGIRTDDEGRNKNVTNSTTIKCQRISCSQKYVSLRVNNKRYSKTYYTNQCRISRTIRDFQSRNNQSNGELSQRRTGLLSIIVPCIHSFERVTMVCPRPRKKTKQLSRYEKTTKRSYLLEWKSLRNAPIIGTSRPQNPAYPSIQFLQKLSSRFCISTNKITGRDRWWFSCQRHNNKTTRSFKNNKGNSTGVCNSSLLDKRNCRDTAQSNQRYKTSTITSIKSVGIMGVWDIEVKNDHSYIAQGFIHHNSSRNPNIQNIPRDGEIKKAFIVPPGYKLVQFDFSQCEFRCWANFAVLMFHNKATSRIFKEIVSGLDIHRQVAADFWGIPPDQVTKDQRTAAKFCTFGVMYGRGAKSVAEQVGITEQEAQTIIDQFFTKYPDAKQWITATQEFCKQTGYVIQQFGRIRRLPTIFSADKKQRAEALRQCINSPIQGTAADITGLCLVRIWKEIQKLQLKAFPVLTVHDSLVFEVPENEVKQFIQLGYKEMTKPIKGIEVPMDVEVQVGENWKDMVQFDKFGEEIKKNEK